jgi:hypothetical protein
VALKVKGVVNRTVQAEEALGGSSRLEPLQLALALSDCLVRILRPIVAAIEPVGPLEARNTITSATSWAVPRRSIGKPWRT